MKNLVISVPRLEIHRPPISTAIVANVIKQAGYDVQALDLNINFLNHVGSHTAYYNFDQVWDGERSITEGEVKFIQDFLDKFTDKIEYYDRIWISVFGGSCHLFTELLCEHVRNKCSKKEIVLGGQGVLTYAIGLDKENFGDVMKEKGLCDIYIAGEGEHTIVDVCKNDLTVPGVNNGDFKQINELNNLPFPDYSFYSLDEYDYLTEDKEVFIVGSRGCVRRCTYCDVAKYWPKFRYRSGKNISEEMILHYEKHGVTRFYFTDSLINGSIKAFHEMCYELAKYNDTHNAPFKWSGQLIFRPKKQLPADHYEIVAKAGGDTFYVGVETGSDKIRWEMDKKFTNDDIQWQLEEFSKHKLHTFFLMITGYLTETIEDHMETLKMFPRWQRFVADGTISGIDFGPTLRFLTDTPLEKMIDTKEVYFLDIGMEKIAGKVMNKNVNLWESKCNPDLDVYERIRRRLEIDKKAMEYNWPTWRGSMRLRTLKLLAGQYRDFLAKTKNPTMFKDDKTGLRWVS